MRNLKHIFAVLLILSINFSCSKHEPEPNNSIDKETICAKWIVNGVTDYESFEFFESGKYVVVKNITTKSIDNQDFIFGTYSIYDSTIILSDFATIKISEINEDFINFSIQSINNNDVNILSASMQEEMEGTAKTLLLCRAWGVVRYNGENVAGTENDATIIFSAAGTYFVKFAYPDEDHVGGLAQWKWKDQTETKFLYTWESPIWNEQDEVEITELTNDILKFYADFDEFYVLEPINN